MKLEGYEKELKRYFRKYPPNGKKYVKVYRKYVERGGVANPVWFGRALRVLGYERIGDRIVSPYKKGKK